MDFPQKGYWIFSVISLSAASQAEAVDIMGRLQLGKKLTPEENVKIVAFLKSLTGEQPTFLMPILPPSTDKTPPPKPFG